MSTRLSHSAPWVTLTGVIMLLVGLGWDAVLHRLDPGLAEREGVFTLTNPGHALFAGGIALAVSGVMLFLMGLAEQQRPVSRLRHTGFTILGGTVLALACGSFGLAMASGGGLAAGHVHAHDDLTHAQTQAENTAAVSPPSGHSHDVGANASTTQSQDLSAAVSGGQGVVHQHGTGVDVTAEQLSAAMKLVDDTRAGTARLQDFRVAQAEGYRQITPFIGGLAHYHNQAYNSDGRILDPERPEELIYLKTSTGQMKLVGVMFLMPSGQPGPRVGGPLTAWHAHDNLCFNSTGMVVALTDAAGKCPQGSIFAGPTPEMLHVWVVDNPDGVFAENMAPDKLVALINGKQPN